MTIFKFTKLIQLILAFDDQLYTNLNIVKLFKFLHWGFSIKLIEVQL